MYRAISSWRGSLVTGYTTTSCHVGRICVAVSAFLSLEQDIESKGEREYWKGKGHMVADNVIPEHDDSVCAYFIRLGA